MSYAPVVLRHVILPSPLGDLLIAGRGTLLSGLWFVGERRCLVPDTAMPFGLCHDPFVEATAQWLSAYFAGRPLPPLPDLRLFGTSFRLAVWRELLDVPYGRVLTYGCLARRVARRLCRPAPAVRAVATSVGHNPVSILVPCHRIVGAHGDLGGYAGGLVRKQALLDLEGAISPPLFGAPSPAVQ